MQSRPARSMHESDEVNCARQDEVLSTRGIECAAGCAGHVADSINVIRRDDQTQRTLRLAKSPPTREASLQDVSARLSKWRWPPKWDERGNCMPRPSRLPALPSSATFCLLDNRRNGQRTPKCCAEAITVNDEFVRGVVKSHRMLSPATSKTGDADPFQAGREKGHVRQLPLMRPRRRLLKILPRATSRT